MVTPAACTGMILVLLVKLGKKYGNSFLQMDNIKLNAIWNIQIQICAWYVLTIWALGRVLFVDLFVVVATL